MNNFLLWWNAIPPWAATYFALAQLRIEIIYEYEVNVLKVFNSVCVGRCNGPAERAPKFQYDT